MESPEALINRLGLPFTDLLLVRRALTHRSYSNENPDAIEDNERLEFLGDAVLDFLVGAWLYHHYPEMSEGELTRLRSGLVRTEQLAEFATHIQLGDAMLLGRGEDTGGGRSRQILLCGMFEALVGALYLNAGLEAVKQFIEPILEGAATQVLQVYRAQDPKSLLQEAVQSQGFGPPVYRTIATNGPDHDRTFEVEVVVNDQVIGHGVGRSKHAAAKLAAADALKRQDFN